MIRSRGAILALLTLLNFINYLDRFLVAGVAPHIQKDLGLSNAQIGTVTSAYLIGYTLTSPLFGWLGDRYTRKLLIASGIFLWSLATVASGLATTFSTMLAARIAVGVGEASYAALAPTIIDDLAPPEKKSRDLAIFYMATPIGSALGFIAGGLLDHHFGWHNAFYIAGGPGLALAFAVMWIREPARSKPEISTDGGATPRARVLRTLLAERGYVLAVGGYIAQTFALGGFVNWAPAYLSRRFCLELKDADFWFGVVTVVTGFLGTGIGGWLADRMKGDRVAVCLRICAWSSVLAAPLALATLFTTSAVSFFIAIAFCELALFVSVSPINAAILMSVPAVVRANAMALSIFAIHALGDAISPPLVGEIADRMNDSYERCSGGKGLQMGMYLLPAALAISAVIWLRARVMKPATTNEA